MKSTVLSILLLIFSFHRTYAQMEVSGRVVDTRQQAIPGATVSLQNDAEDQGVITDQTGAFRLNLADTGSHELTVRFLGYETYRKSYEFRVNQAYDLGAVVLTESSQELPTVEVVGRWVPKGVV